MSPKDPFTLKEADPTWLRVEFSHKPLASGTLRTAYSGSIITGPNPSQKAGWTLLSDKTIPCVVKVFNKGLVINDPELWAGDVLVLRVARALASKV